MEQIRIIVNGLQSTGLNLKEISKGIGIGPSTLSDYLNGKGNPSKKTISAIRLFAEDWEAGRHRDLLPLSTTTLQQSATEPFRLPYNQEGNDDSGSPEVAEVDPTQPAEQPNARSSSPTAWQAPQDSPSGRIQKELASHRGDRSDGSSPEEKDDPLTHEFFLPVVGFCWFTDQERMIIDHPAFQRLGKLSQLGLAFTVFRGATHRRFEHVLGTVEITERMIKAIRENHVRAIAKQVGAPAIGVNVDQYDLAAPPTATERRYIRLAALLHDIGHLPFGHSIEDELHLLNKHDKEARLRKIMLRRTWYGQRVPCLASVIEGAFGQDNWDGTMIPKVRAFEVALSIILRSPVNRLGFECRRSLQNPSEEDVEKEFSVRCANAGIRLQMCSDIVGNTICADLLDYLHRDWYHVGKPKYLEDRLFQYMEIRGRAKPDTFPAANGTSPTVVPGQKSKKQYDDSLVINIGRHPRLRTDGVSGILDLLESRYHLSEAVLFHRTKLKATAMLERCLAFAFGDVNRPPSAQNEWESDRTGWNHDLEDFMLDTPEDALLPKLADSAPIAGAGAQNAETQQIRRELARRLLVRDYYEHLLTVNFDEANPDAIRKVQDLYADSNNNADPPLNRERALRLAETDFGLVPGDLAVYCPERRMNDKIAKVQVFVGGEVHELEAYEHANESALTGGHLDAQLRRFRRLWRIGFYFHPRIVSRLDQTSRDDYLDALRDYVRVMILGIVSPGAGDTKRGDAALLAEGKRVAVRLSHLQPFLDRFVGPTGRLHVRPHPQQSAARTAGAGLADRFPTEMPSIWAWLQESSDDDS